MTDCKQSDDHYYGMTCTVHSWSHMPDEDKPCERARIEEALALCDEFRIQLEWDRDTALLERIEAALRGGSDE